MLKIAIVENEAEQVELLRGYVARNQWFIPGLDTPEQGACLSQAIAGVVFYVLSIAATIAAAFAGKFARQDA